jgi:hypothetical protein
MGEDIVLAEDHPIPSRSSSVFCVATDDIVFLSSERQRRGREAVRRLDREFVSRNILKNASKDIDGSLEGTMIGIDLCDGTFFAAHAPRLAELLFSGVALISAGAASPLQIAAFIGFIQWFDLLCRPTFSVFDLVYAFVRSEPQGDVAPLSNDVIGELTLALLLAPFWEVDLTRGWSSVLGASDASTDFGFGVCAAKIAPSLSRRIGRAAGRGIRHVRLKRVPGQVYKQRPRQGDALNIPLRRRDFRQILSVRFRHPNNIVALEGDAALLLVRWLCRSSSNHSKRVPVLIDAQSVLGAILRGRSSSPSLKFTMRRISAFVLAADMALKPVYTPSEDNPADDGSRGVEA